MNSFQKEIYYFVIVVEIMGATILEKLAKWLEAVRMNNEAMSLEFLVRE